MTVYVLEVFIDARKQPHMSNGMYVHANHEDASRHAEHWEARGMFCNITLGVPFYSEEHKRFPDKQ